MLATIATMEAKTYQERLDMYCASLVHADVADDTECGVALDAAAQTGPLVARFGLNKNGQNLKWRCYSKVVNGPATQNACISNNKARVIQKI